MAANLESQYSSRMVLSAMISDMPENDRTGLGWLRYETHLVLENPSYNKLANAINNVILTTIVVSTSVFVVTSMREYADNPHLEICETVAIFIFTVEVTLLLEPSPAASAATLAFTTPAGPAGGAEPRTQPCRFRCHARLHHPCRWR